jgi:hypothetical protein
MTLLRERRAVGALVRDAISYGAAVICRAHTGSVDGWLLQTRYIRSTAYSARSLRGDRVGCGFLRGAGERALFHQNEQHTG